MGNVMKYLIAIAFALASTAHANLTVFAPASLTHAINELNQTYQAQTHTRIKTSYASSGTLARQIEQGAKADVFISADTAWVHHLQNKGKVVAGTYRPLLGNRLVLITQKSSKINTIVMDKRTDFGKFLTGKLCTGNTKSVPVGRYAKQALTHLGWTNAVMPRLVETEDVRQALNFVNRGECQFGIVYATDAKIASHVKVVGTFLNTSHAPIVYPMVLIRDNLQSRAYYQFLQSETAKKIYQKHGFSVL